MIDYYMRTNDSDLRKKLWYIFLMIIWNLQILN